MTPQQIFDTVTAHLITQGRPCKKATVPGGESLLCLYRGPDGTKCAVGVLIPDHMYRPQMESNDLFMLIAKAPTHGFALPDYFEANQGLLSDLQEVHDTCRQLGFNGPFDIKKLRRMLRDVAVHWELEFKE